MNKTINKIAFLVHDPLLYDHWVGIWRLLDSARFEIVILDFFRNSPNEHFRKYSEEFLDRISKANYNYRFLRDVLSKNMKYRYVISNHLVQGSTLYNQITFKIKFKNYIKIIVNFIFRVLKVKKLFHLCIANQYLPMQIGIKRIRFMYGADISEGWSLAKWNEMFDVFLCHGPNDAGAVSSRNLGKEIIQIGYPRYDDYFNIPNLGEDLKRSFSLSPLKKTILWLPTFGNGVCSIPYYVKQISKLTQNYNVVVRPHPITFRLAPENIKLLFDYHLMIDEDALRDMNELYSIADFVLCDYGGTSFSALYLDKNIILLNTPGSTEWYTSNKSSNLELRKEISPVLDVQDATKLNDIFQDKSIWFQQAKQRKRVFAKYFAPYQGTSATRVALFLSGLSGI